MATIEEISQAMKIANDRGDHVSAAKLARVVQKHENAVRNRASKLPSIRTGGGVGGAGDILPGVGRGVTSTFGLAGDLAGIAPDIDQGPGAGRIRALRKILPTTKGIREGIDSAVDFFGGKEDDSIFRGGENTAIGRASEFVGGTLVFGAPGLAKTAVREGIKSFGKSALKQTVGGGVAGVGSFVGEEVGGTTGAIVGSFVPAGIFAAAKAALKVSLRGAGRANQFRMQAAIRQVENQGGVATLGSTSPVSRGASIERIVESVPGGNAPFLRAARANEKGMQERISKLLGNASYREESAGTLIKSSLKSSIDKMRTRSRELYDKAASKIDNPNALVPVARTKQRLKELTNEIPKSEFDDIFNSVKLQDDIAGDLLATMSNIDTAAGTGVMEWWAVNHLRKIVGQQISLRNAVGDPSQGVLKQIYSVLSKDVQSGAMIAGGNGARRAFKNANNHWKAGRREVDDLINPMIRKDMQPELLFRDVVGSSLNKPTKLSLALRGMNPTQREYFGKTFIAKLGNIDDTSGKVVDALWSPGRLIRNWEKIPTSQRIKLFSSTPELKKLGTELNRYIRVLERQKLASGVLANPSGTAGTGLAAATLQSALANGSKLLTFGLGGAAIGGAAGSLAAIGGTMASANLMARLMTNPAGVRWIATASAAPLKALPMHLARLNTLAQDQDPDFVQAVDALNSALLIEVEKIEDSNK